ncbi:hypothetical protein O3M35_010429 [Rhynocoris fuscipes]|uniref:Distal membrane-arm assembly complex protein 1-like domain-containing protein n=1 Tax=Rhynocoris fuscipes TaxID=488301 RepID=A0AAW1D2H6_9HEMI
MEGNKEYEDCLSCRLIGGLSFVGIGTYIYYQGNKTKGAQSLGFKFIASCFGLIGIARMLNLGPFNRERSVTEISANRSQS